MRITSRLFLLVVLALSPCVISHAAEKQPIRSPSVIEVIPLGQRVTRKYKFVSPISDQSRTEQKTFDKMREEAVKRGADAIIDFSCDVMNQEDFWGLTRPYSVCNGKAVKWVGAGAD